MGAGMVLLGGRRARGMGVGRAVEMGMEMEMEMERVVGLERCRRT